MSALNLDIFTEDHGNDVQTGFGNSPNGTNPGYQWANPESNPNINIYNPAGYNGHYNASIFGYGGGEVPCDWTNETLCNITVLFDSNYTKNESGGPTGHTSPYPLWQLIFLSIIAGE